ncbi:MAG: outer membrane protein assembly factor BamA [Desulfosudaceae bacterium]
MKIAAAAAVLTAVLLMVLSPAPVLAAQETNRRVLLFPPQVYSPDNDREEMAGQLQKMLTEQLDARGISVVSADRPVDTSLPAAEKRSRARQAQADSALWGSLTALGGGFSLDVTVLPADEAGEGEHFFISKDVMASLPTAVDELCGDVAAAISGRSKIVEIRVEGNQRIEAEAIKRTINAAEGDLFDRRALSKDLAAIHEMGYFEDIRIVSQKTSAGRIVTFHVQERPTVRKIHIKKNTLFDDEEILAELDLQRGSIVNLGEIQNGIKNIEKLYTDKNYYNVKVTYEIQPRDNNQADLEFTIERGEKFHIQGIAFEGNQAYSDKELKKIIKTSEKGLLLWIITSAGDLKEDQLQQDIGRLASHYQNHGYIDARIGDPRIVYGEPPEDWGVSEEETGTPPKAVSNTMISDSELTGLEKQEGKTGKKAGEKEKGIYITFEIEEGQQYYVDAVSLGGDLIKSRETLRQKIHVAEDSVFNRSLVQKDLVMLDSLYSDQGYYYVKVYPETTRNEEERTVDINYQITKGEPVYFDNIIITGNTKTRDKVIRRQLDVYEQELYSGKRLKKSISRLYRLDYFENVDVSTVEKPDKNAIDLKLDVTEKPTGEFSFGGGYSSLENAFATASITQRNLFGRGQSLSLRGEVGGTTTQYRLSFTEPWLFDIPLSAGFDLYNWQVDYDTYDKNATGGGLRFGYPIFENTRLYLSNTYEVNKITNVSLFASQDIQDLDPDLKEKSVLSSVSASLVYDTRNRGINPSEGVKHSVTIEKAGGIFGGDIVFTKYTGETSWYQPLFWKLVGFAHSEIGYVREGSNGYLPDYERFYLGGMNSLRGFDWHDIAIREEVNTPSGTYTDESGGNKYVQFNAELHVPLFDEKIGLVGLLFYDTGNIYDDGENMDLGQLRESAGFGVRWYSPMGPIRLERGYILDPEEGEDSGGRWEFTMGTAF